MLDAQSKPNITYRKILDELMTLEKQHKRGRRNGTQSHGSTKTLSSSYSQPIKLQPVATANNICDGNASITSFFFCFWIRSLSKCVSATSLAEKRSRSEMLNSDKNTICAELSNTLRLLMIAPQTNVAFAKQPKFFFSVILSW